MGKRELIWFGMGWEGGGVGWGVVVWGVCRVDSGCVVGGRGGSGGTFMGTD